MKIFNSLLTGLALVSSCSPACAANEAGVTPAIVEAAKFDDQPLLWGAQRNDGEVVFSGAGDTVSTNDIVGIDLVSGRKRLVLRGLSSGRFMTRDERFIVITRSEQEKTRLILFPSSGGDRLAETTIDKLIVWDGILWAGILGDRLVVVQQDNRQPGATAILMELPSLNRLKTVTVSRISGAAVWKNNVLLLGKSLEYFDRDMKSQALVAIPPTPPLPGHGCHDGPLRVEGDRAVAVLACGYIHVFDLAKRRHQLVIPRYADSYGLDIARDLLFTTPAYWVNFGSGGRIFDLRAGRELATFPFAGEALFATGGGLAALSAEPSQRPQITLYKYDAEALRDGRWQIARAAEGCAAAREIAAAGDLAVAADRCETAGILSVPREAWRRPPLAPLAREYARWLSLALDRRPEAIAALGAVRGPAPDLELTSWGEEVRLKQLLLNAKSDLPVTATPRRGSFSEVFSRGSQQFTSTPIPVRFGMWPNLLQFSGDRAYVARRGCDGIGDVCTDDKHYLDVLDQSTFRLIRSVEVKGLETDDNFISSVAAYGKRIYVMASYRYEHEPRPNLFAYDAETLERVALATLPVDRRVVVREGNLLACACGTEGGQACLAVDPETLEFGEAPSWSCVGSGDNSQVLRAPVGTAALATPNYFVSPLPHGRRDNGFEFSVRDVATAAPPKPRLLTGDMRSNIYPVPEADRVVTLRYYPDRARLGLFDIPGGRFVTLENLENTCSHVAVVADTRHVYVGRCRDLLVYDQVGQRLQHYIRDFIPNDGSPNTILRLLVVGSRLVVLTNGGRASRMLELGQFDSGPTKPEN